MDTFSDFYLRINSNTPNINYIFEKPLVGDNLKVALSNIMFTLNKVFYMKSTIFKIASYENTYIKSKNPIIKMSKGMFNFNFNVDVESQHDILVDYRSNYYFRDLEPRFKNYSIMDVLELIIYDPFADMWLYVDHNKMVRSRSGADLKLRINNSSLAKFMELEHKKWYYIKPETNTNWFISKDKDIEDGLFNLEPQTKDIIIFKKSFDGLENFCDIFNSKTNLCNISVNSKYSKLYLKNIHNFPILVHLPKEFMNLLQIKKSDKIIKLDIGKKRKLKIKFKYYTYNHFMYVYSNNVESSFVGKKYSNLLRIIPFKIGKHLHGQTLNINLRNEMFVPVLNNKYLYNFEIQIHDEKRLLYDFMKNIFIILHFRNDDSRKRIKF